ncbi:uncharacterized protein EV422DRAFT_279499 [Fimicolochytrium jonesii]|uniref:uncharacterized protein n=1 Tax=Fimicolochytrium jonesii TaxID=1396493 RepID=UPI0022FDBFB2|nr:uncharacterized protein EV422DRAFT_279499 [Fimicolochytrium jonesii]KAI8816581.1 hypothetical protein EV422DRAFT_279499 [Fimicolochytrium jonesii]
MEVLSRNPYDLLDDEGGDAPVAKASPAKKDDKKAAPAAAKKDAAPKKQTERAPRNEYPRRGGAAGAPRGGADVARPPRQNRDGGDFETPREQRVADGERRERGGFRGGRGGRGGSRGGFRGREFDRHSGSGRTDGVKKEVAGAGSWGNPLTAEEEAKVDVEPVEGAEKKEGAETPVEEETPREPEPEESYKTLEQFLAERTKPATEAKVRKANEGADDAQWKNAVPLKKEEDEELFADLLKVKKAKAAAAKEKAQKTFVNIDQRFADEGRNTFSPRGGRGGNRGGEFRGGRGGSDRNGGAGGRGGRGGRQSGAGSSVSIEDQNAFPSLK